MSLQEQKRKNSKSFGSMLDIDEYARVRNLQLEVGNFERKSAYEIEHRDGSKFLVTNYLIETVTFQVPDTFDEIVYIIYSEHHNPFIYMWSDLIRPPQYKKLKKKKRKND
jgi:hypothetical protein